MKRQSIANRLMRNYRPEQGRKRKRRMHRLWQQPGHVQKEPSRRRWQKPWEQSRQLFNQRLGRAAVIHLQLQWPRVPCVRRAAKSVGNSFAESWEEFSAAVGDEGSCSGACAKHRTCRVNELLTMRPIGSVVAAFASNAEIINRRLAQAPLQQKNRRIGFAQSGDLSRSSFIAWAKPPDWLPLSFRLCRPSLPRLWPTSYK